MKSVNISGIQFIVPILVEHPPADRIDGGDILANRY